MIKRVNASELAAANQKTLVIISAQCTVILKEVSGYFKVSENTIKRKIVDHIIPGEKRFGRWYVDAVWFEAQKNKRTVVARHF